MNGIRCASCTLVIGLLLLAASPGGRAAEAPENATAAASAGPAATAPPVGSLSLSFSAPTLYPPAAPTRLRLSILSGPAERERAARLAVLLEEYRRRELEEKIGLKLELLFVSTVNGSGTPRNVIYYRPGFLRAALFLAEAIPGRQTIQPMEPERLMKEGVDVEVWVGEQSP